MVHLVAGNLVNVRPHELRDAANITPAALFTSGLVRLFALVGVAAAATWSVWSSSALQLARAAMGGTASKTRLQACDELWATRDKHWVA